MSSSSRASSPSLEEIERILREHGLDERRASQVRRVLEEEPTPVRIGAFTELDGGRASQLPTVGARNVAIAATLVADATTPQPRVDSLPSPASEAGWTPRLVVGELLAAGGMGEVYRVQDWSLHRTLAMKVLLGDLRDQAHLRDRFLEEAQVTAQLAHPGVVPVHEIGVLEDGRPFFTMKEVRGITLAQVIDEWQRGEESGARAWSEQRRLEIFQKVCEAVAYAHARGVAHCDLKPHNVMVGAFGEVLVMDWGVARMVPPSMGAASEGTGEPPVMTAGLSGMEGWIVGTPAYMPPEQARGEVSRLGPPADVFALGVMLYELLSGVRPYRGAPKEMLAQAEAFALPELPRVRGSAADDALFAIVAKAMRPDPEERYPDAKAMADELARWREGALRREKALAVVREAEALLPERSPELGQVALVRQLRERATRELEALGPDAAADAKARAWALQDEAAAMENEIALRTVLAEQRLHAALAHAPDLAEAKRLLARLRYERHREAERRRDWDEAARHEVVLRAHDLGEHRDYLEGLASLTLVTAPRCRVRLLRHAVRDRRLVASFVRDLGETPLVDVELPVGSYLLELAADDRPTVRYPIVLRRRGGWTGRRPNESTPWPVFLPSAEALRPGEIWIADGCFERGGDERAPGALPSECVWLAGFAIDEHPVTCAELAEFLEAREGAPFRRGVLREGLGIWSPDRPAIGVSWEAASALARFRSRRTGLDYRLPTELEWEKAARGVDGRFYPWGDFTDASLCHARTVERAPSGPTSIAAFPTDASPYGVRGMGGNVRDWCDDAAMASNAGAGARAGERIVRGGSWRQPPEAARVAARTALVASRGYADVGVRLVRTLRR